MSVATTAEAVAVGTGSSSPSAGVSLAVADCLVASNEEVAQEAAAQQEQVSENETPVVESEYADIAIAQVDNLSLIHIYAMLPRGSFVHTPSMASFPDSLQTVAVTMPSGFSKSA